jgi:hypothetical protein
VRPELNPQPPTANRTLSLQLAAMAANSKRLSVVPPIHEYATEKAATPPTLPLTPP